MSKKSNHRQKSRRLEEEQWQRLSDERAALTNPIDKMAFDNQWIDGMPVGLILMAGPRKLHTKHKRSR